MGSFRKAPGRSGFAQPQECPNLAAIAAGIVEAVGGWTYWTLVRDPDPVATLQEFGAK